MLTNLSPYSISLPLYVPLQHTRLVLLIHGLILPVLYELLLFNPTLQCCYCTGLLPHLLLDSHHIFHCMLPSTPICFNHHSYTDSFQILLPSSVLIWIPNYLSVLKCIFNFLMNIFQGKQYKKNTQYFQNQYYLPPTYFGVFWIPLFFFKAKLKWDVLFALKPSSLVSL